MHRRLVLLQRLVAFAALVLVGLTWRLWTPQTMFPQVPLFARAGAAPVWLEWTTAALMVGALAVALIVPATNRVGRAAVLVYVAAAIGLVLIDQHRLQPWAYQFVLMALVLGLATDGERESARSAAVLRLLQWLAISIYFHSALSKLDYSFLNSSGQELLLGTLNRLGIHATFWSPAARRIAAAILPVGELLVALGLCFRRTRFAALAGSIAMHAGLLLALGPWGLNHRPGVLVWNAYFILQNLVLFGGRPHADAPVSKSPAPRHPLGQIAATSLIVLAALLPFLEPFGLFDHWPAWAVYASRPEHVEVFVAQEGRDKLPPELNPYVDRPRFPDGWSRVRIDQWSLHALGLPIYPEDRFRIGIALAIARRYDLGSGVLVEIESSANRWTGARSHRELRGIDAIAREARQFLINATPRGRLD